MTEVERLSMVRWNANTKAWDEYEKATASLKEELKRQLAPFEAIRKAACEKADKEFEEAVKRLPPTDSVVEEWLASHLDGPNSDMVKRCLDYIWSLKNR